MAELSGFFGGVVTATALLSGFSFAAALQLMGRDDKDRGVYMAAFVLYVSTLLFLFSMIGFNNASVRQYDGVQMLNADGTFSSDFYRIYRAELLLVCAAIVSFLTGVIASAWTRNRTMGWSLLGLIGVIMTAWLLWFFEWI